MTEFDERTMRIRDLNDQYRADTCFPLGPHLHNGRLVITHGVALRGNEFIDCAMRAVREYTDFTPENDPYGEHDFGTFTLGELLLFWKINCFDHSYEYGSPDPADAEKTRRVLTIMLAAEY